ncbi:MAG: bifunctional hydroxymethylpyrimidine kinase/phosphomethylpyrimidine kinase [Verrucomicrobiota bacterium]
MISREHPVALTIATSDSGAGAGVQADLLSFAARGVYGLSAFAALTAQSPEGVSAIHELPPDFLRAQLDQLKSYYAIGAVKTGMLFSAPLIEETAAFVSKLSVPCVVDPVMVATSGAVLLQPEAITTLETQLLPQATLITPNLDEAAVLLQGERPTSSNLPDAAHALAKKYGTAVLLKGGHLEGNQLVDVLAETDGTLQRFQTRRVEGVNTHGSGCTLSAAITAELAKGQPLPAAVKSGHTYLQACLQAPLQLGETPFISHLASMDKPGK